MEHKLAQIPLFRGLEPVDIDELLKQIIYQRRSYETGNIIVSQGEECNRLMILIDGKVKTEMASPSGKSLKIEDMQAPATLAPAFLFGKSNFFPVNTIATSSCSFIVIRKAEILRLFQMNEVVLQNFLTMISSRAQFLSEKLRFHSFKALRAKLAFYLINEADTNKSFKLRHSQNELAELFGVARPSVGRAFLQLQEEGVIDVRYKQVQIKEIERLREACNE